MNNITQLSSDLSTQLFPHPVLMFDDATEELIEAIKGASNQGKFKIYIYIDPKNPTKIYMGYVGVTEREIVERHSDHLRDAKRYPQRPFYRYLLKNPNAQPFVLACGTKDEISKLEELLRPHSYVGWNSHKGGGASKKGRKNLKAGSNKGLEVHTLDGCFESRKSAATHYKCSVSTISRRCNLELPGYEEWSWHNHYTDEPVVLLDDPITDIQRCIATYSGAYL